MIEISNRTENIICFKSSYYLKQHDFSDGIEVENINNRDYNKLLDLENNNFISRILIQGEYIIFVFRNPAIVESVVGNIFTEILGTSHVRIKDEYLDKVSIDPIYAIKLHKSSLINNNPGYFIALNEVLGTYFKVSHPNLNSSGTICLGNYSIRKNKNSRILFDIYNTILRIPCYNSPHNYNLFKDRDYTTYTNDFKNIIRERFIPAI
jgi:hypothetical protein